MAEDTDRDIALEAAVAALKSKRELSTVLDLAGCFTGDEDWKAIAAEIETQRQQPDPELAASRGTGSTCPRKNGH